MSVGCEISGEGGTSPNRISDVGYPGGMLAEKNSGCENFRPGGKKIDIRSNSIRIPQAGLAIRINSIRIPQAGTGRLRTSHTRMIAYPIRTRHSRSSHPDDSISYPDMLSRSLTYTPCILDFLMTKDFKASVLPIALPWIPKNSP